MAGCSFKWHDVVDHWCEKSARHAHGIHVCPCGACRSDDDVYRRVPVAPIEDTSQHTPDHESPA